MHIICVGQCVFEHTSFFRKKAQVHCTLCRRTSLADRYSKPEHSSSTGATGKTIMQTRKRGHELTHHPVTPPATDAEHELSAREIEVLRLVTKGLINKEIADKLHISLTTVISHRKTSQKIGY